MNELILVKSEHFGQVETDIYSNGSDMFMTISQLAACLEYSDKKQVEKLIERNPYLKEKEFSFIQEVPPRTGGTQKTRIFTEDGIYEVTILYKQPKARQFRAWIRSILKSLRSGQTKLVGMTGYQQMMAETRRQNLAVQRARILNQIAAEYEGTTYKQVLQAHATKELTGEYLLPLPKLEAKTYSAQEVGDILGISANQVGRLANQNHLKDPGHGQWFKDKSPYGNKEVSTFRYYENTVDALRKILAQSERKEA